LSAVGACVVVLGAWLSQTACLRVPQPADADAGSPLGAAPIADAGAGDQDALPVTPPLVLGGVCDVDLEPARTFGAAAGTLAAPGPYRPCRVVGGQQLQMLVVSADGGRVAGLGAGGQVQVLDGATLAPLATFVRARGAYSAVAISGDGSRIAAGAERDGELDVWSVDDQALLAAVDLGATWPSFGGAVAISVDGAMAAASAGASIVAVEVATGERRTYAAGGRYIGALAFVNGAGTLAIDGYDFSTVGSGYGTLRLLHPDSGALTTVFGDHSTSTTEQMFASADGRTIVTSGEQVRIWNAAGGTLRAAFTQNGSLQLLGVSADGSELVTSLQTRTPGDPVSLQRRRASDGAVVDQFPVQALSATGWAWGGGLLVAPAGPSLDGLVLIAVDGRAHRVLARACSAAPADIAGLSRDGARAVGRANDLALAFDVQSGLPLLRSTKAMWSQSQTQTVVMSPDGRKVAWALLPDYAGVPPPAPVTASIADVDSGATATLSGREAVVVHGWVDMVFSGDSSRLAVLDPASTILDVFDTDAKVLLREQLLPLGNGRLFGFSADGQAVIIQQAAAIETMSWQDGTILASWTPPRGSVTTASLDGGAALAEDGQTAIIYRDASVVTSFAEPFDGCFAPSILFTFAASGAAMSMTYDCSRPWLSPRGLFTEILDAASGSVMQTLPMAMRPAFSWDGSMFANRDTIWCR
jgi:hypothetical protein